MSTTLFSRHSSQIVKFCVTGGLGALVDLGTLRLLVEYGHMTPQTGSILSTLLAVIVVFLGNKYFTFQDKSTGVVKQLGKFAIVYVFAYTLNQGITLTLLAFGVYYLMAKAVAIGIGAVINYLLSHGFIFRKAHTPEVPVV